MKKETVGKSSRTPFKHWVLDSHLGQITGVLSRRSPSVPAIPNPFLCIDLCAGDGTETDGHKSSPKIITKHCEWLAEKGFNVQSVMIEKHSATFESLESSIDTKKIKHSCVLKNEDAREFIFKPSCLNQAVFLNCDPNSIADMPFSERLAKSLTKTTTMTLTLGCNVGGLKRLKKEQRKEWFDYIDTMIRIMPPWHDAILVSIERDDAQWAYFTRLPSVWSKQQSDSVFKKGLSMFKNGVRVESYRFGIDGFRDLIKRLFLTKVEVSNG